MLKTLTTIFGLAVAPPGLTHGLSDPSNLTIAPLAADTFEVIEGHGAGARGLWCAAADHARDALNPGGGARLYVVTPRGPSQTVRGRAAVTFSLSPQDTVPRQTVIAALSTYQAGSTLSVSHALSLCAGQRVPGGL